MIRKATTDDLAAVLKINTHFIPKVSKVDDVWLKRYLVEADVFDVYESDSGEIDAFVIGMSPAVDYDSMNFAWFKQRYEDFLYIDRIAVAESAHGKGIGKKLYEHIENVYSAKFSSITCEVNIRPPNPQSYEFHLKVGFKEVGQQDTKEIEPGKLMRVAMLKKDF